MAKINRTKNAARNIVFGIMLKLYQTLIPFLMRTAMIYFMGVQYLGLNSLFTSVLQVLNLAELGVGAAMVYSMYKPIVEDDKERICALMQLYKIYYRIIGLLIAVIGIILTPFIPKLINGSVPGSLNIYILYLLNLFTTVFSYWLFAYKSSILQAHQRNDIVSKVTLFTNTFQYGLQLIVLWLVKNYYVYIIIALFTQLLTNIVTAVVANKLYPDYKAYGTLPKKEVIRINQRIKDLFTAKLGSVIVNSADTIVISSFLGLTILAIYQNYYFIMTSIIGFLMLIMASCTAGIGNSLIVESIEKNYKDFKMLNLIITWLSGICVCCFLNIYQPFMILWVGKENLLDFSCVILLCFYFYFYSTNHLMATYKDAAGIWHEDRFRPLISSMFNLIMNLVLVRYIGIFAIILSTVLSYALVNIPWLIHNTFTLIFKQSSHEFIFKYVVNMVKVCASAVLTFLVCLLLPSMGFAAIISRFLVSVVVSNVIFIVLFRKDEEYLSMFGLFNKLTKYKLNLLVKLVTKGCR